MLCFYLKLFFNQHAVVDFTGKNSSLLFQDYSVEHVSYEAHKFWEKKYWESCTEHCNKIARLSVHANSTDGLIATCHL